MHSLTKGANAPLDDMAAEIVIRWRASVPAIAEIDIAGFMLRATRKVAGDDDMIFYGQPASSNGALRLTGAARPGADGIGETRFAVDMGRLPAEVEAIAFTATLDKGQSFANVSLLEISVWARGAKAIDFPVPVAGATEAALILGELYKRNGQWKFKAVAQGFNGGLKPLAESFGVVVSDDAPAAPPPPPPPVVAPAAAAAASPSINLSKVTLNKDRPSINLAKKAGSDSLGEVRINLNWNRNNAPQKTSFFGGRPKGVDLDLGCLVIMKNGSKGGVQALGNAFGAYDSPPFIQLSGDDRTGAVADGEWLRMNGRYWPDLEKVLVYAFIYEGTPNWAATDGVVTIYAPGSPPVEIRLEERGSNANTCAIALLENVNGELRITHEVRYFRNQPEMDRAYGFGLNWGTGTKS